MTTEERWREAAIAVLSSTDGDSGIPIDEFFRRSGRIAGRSEGEIQAAIDEALKHHPPETMVRRGDNYRRSLVVVY